MISPYGSRPTNTSLLQPTKFQVVFARTPAITYFCQSINIPGLSISELPRPTPLITQYVPGNKLMYETFNIKFLLDEDLRSWFEIHDWLRGLAPGQSTDEYKKLVHTNAPFGGIYSDAQMTVNTNNNNSNIKINFKNCFPINLSRIDFSSELSAENTMTADVTLRFEYFNIERKTS